ncbi:Dihydroorotate dehydrogenase A (fumarate) [Cytospora mali]|uniref:Dihydroorotate dehydrogenase (fumarate) n=1 Tax=Cytospora mali TaxID=578113 RepID=A0A194UUV1_CYTMA|nr:Dihydroorotate dehydrogenase A (fumarate) [Valsa mali var. pyri (nom. inval.)]
MSSNTPPPVLKISPPLVNSANPWATNLDDLKALYECSHTGAVTTRTSLISGFPHDPSTHQFTLFDAATHVSEQDRTKLTGHENASLNTLGYSPYILADYITFIRNIAETPTARPEKGFIISVTGSPEEVAMCYQVIAYEQTQVPFPLAMEINLSCPNIPDKPPPAYNAESLLPYLTALGKLTTDPDQSRLPRIAFGLKTPPYTHASEYSELFRALKDSATEAPGGISPVSFITATNTLGSCLILADPEAKAADGPALPAPGIGGMAGAPLHPLALGNVRTIRRMLDEKKDQLGHIEIIGVGGVLDGDGFKRMKAVGADIVGVGTGLGIKGVGIFEAIHASSRS